MVQALIIMQQYSEQEMDVFPQGGILGTYTFEKKISKRPQKIWENDTNHKSNEMMLKPPKNDLAFNMLYYTIACSR